MFALLKETIKEFKFYGHDIEDTPLKFKMRVARPAILFTSVICYLAVVNDELVFRDYDGTKWYSR